MVVAVCASVAGEVSPVWPGAPLTVHWGIEDPASAPQDQIDVAFQIAYHQLSARINAFLALPFERLTPEVLKSQLTAIGTL